MFGCLFGHDWKIINSHISKDMSFGPPGYLHTCVLEKCSRCGKINSRYIDGVWNKDQIQGDLNITYIYKTDKEKDE